MHKKYVHYYEGLYKLVPIKFLCTIIVFIVYHLVSSYFYIFNLFYKGKRSSLTNQRDTFLDKKDIPTELDDLFQIRIYEKPNFYSIKRNEARDLDLSIIVPCYNSEEYLQNCLISILEQKTSYTFEIIIINDGSTDGTETIINSFKNDKRIIVITQKNQGMSSARNAGLEIARGEYLTFLDSDDALGKDAIETCLNIAFRKRLDILEGNYQLLLGNKIRSTLSKKDFLYELDNTPKVDFYLSLKSYAWGKFYHYSLWDNVIFPANMAFQDTIICQLIIRKAKNYGYTNQIIYYYRVHKKSITVQMKCHGNSLDSLYLIDYILKENLRLSLPQDSIHYHLLLKQMGDILYRRLKGGDPSILETSFIVLKYYLNAMEPFRPQTLDSYEQILIKSIQTQDLRTWRWVSSI